MRDFNSAALAFPGVTLAGLPGLSCIAAPEEGASTFEGNAVIKALAYGCLAPRQIVVADDSGIEVPALGGAPGVRSARYADDMGYMGSGGLTGDERNTACLLEAGSQLPEAERAASYRCVLAAVLGGKLLATGTGSLDGTLLRVPRGLGGFGYDPIFYLPGLNKTMAEIDGATRLELSHRGRALKNLIEILQRHRPT